MLWFREVGFEVLWAIRLHETFPDSQAYFTARAPYSYPPHAIWDKNAACHRPALKKALQSGRIRQPTDGTWLAVLASEHPKKHSCKGFLTTIFELSGSPPELD
jgi:hypothetical protein